MRLVPSEMPAVKAKARSAIHKMLWRTGIFVLAEYPKVRSMEK